MVIVVVVVVMIKYLVMLAACFPGSSSMASACAGSLALLDAGTHWYFGCALCSGISSRHSFLTE